MPTFNVSGTILLLFLLLPFSLSDSPSDDAQSLIQFKSSFVVPDPDPLAAWSPASSPCNPKSPWPGVICDKNSVTGLRLAGLKLSGASINVEPLQSLTALRSVSLDNNALSGPIPAFSRLDSLKSIYLSNNKFSGDIPDDYFANMDHLKKFWVDGNALTGKIPSSISKAVTLIELQLQNNQFSGELPDISISSLTNFNVSGNTLTGKIPDGLSKKFKAESFAGNPGLCGSPLANPCALPEVEAEAEDEKEGESGGGISTVVIVIIVITALIIVLTIGVVFIKNRRRNREFRGIGVMSDVEARDAAAAVEASQNRMAQAAGSSSSRRRGGGSSRGGVPSLVMVNEERGVFGLPELMKAAAEVLGNGGMGSAYKAVMENGTAVAVKRMRELNRLGREGFDGEMRRYGRLRHRNVLPPLAYLYRRDEKLVVSEYVSKGNLLYILHGDRGPDHAALDWLTRLKIIRGIVRGMSHLHSELATIDVPHANLKSSNVLLTPDYEPLLVDYGFLPLLNPSLAPSVLFSFKSPESLLHHHVSPKSDVYCLGVLILEILTGKFPSQYLNDSARGGTDVVMWAVAAIKEGKEVELLDPNMSRTANDSVEDMVEMLKVGAMCTEASLEERPAMRQVVEIVEEIARSSLVTAASQRPAAPAAVPDYLSVSVSVGEEAPTMGLQQRTGSVKQSGS